MPAGQAEELARHPHGPWEPSTGCDGEVTGGSARGQENLASAAAPQTGPRGPGPHLVHSGQDPAIAPAEGADLGHLPGGIVGEAKLHELALQGKGLGQNPPRPRTLQRGDGRGWGPWEWGLFPGLLWDDPGASTLLEARGLASPPGAAGGRHAVFPPQGCRGLGRVGRRGPPGDTVAVSGTSPTGPGHCQASATSLPRDWPW